LALRGDAAGAGGIGSSLAAATRSAAAGASVSAAGAGRVVVAAHTVRQPPPPPTFGGPALGTGRQASASKGSLQQSPGLPVTLAIADQARVAAAAAIAATGHGKPGGNHISNAAKRSAEAHAAATKRARLNIDPAGLRLGDAAHVTAPRPNTGLLTAALEATRKRMP
jgi:hypothetical protein